MFFNTSHDYIGLIRVYRPKKHPTKTLDPFGAVPPTTFGKLRRSTFGRIDEDPSPGAKPPMGAGDIQKPS